MKEYKEENQFLHITFKEISEWLNICLTKTKPTLVRSFIEQMIIFIDDNINGELEMSEQENISNIILQSPENIKSAFSAMRSIDHIKRNLLRELMDDMKSKFKTQAPPCELNSPRSFWKDKDMPDLRLSSPICLQNKFFIWHLSSIVRVSMGYSGGLLASMKAFPEIHIFGMPYMI